MTWGGGMDGSKCHFLDRVICRWTDSKNLVGYFYRNITHPKILDVERHRWNTSQLKSQNKQKCVGGTPVSWFWVILGVPSDGEKVVALIVILF